MDDYRNRIVADPEVMMGKPAIRGTRITVEFLLRMTAAGRTIEEMLEEYPHLTREDILAAHEFAADHIRQAFVQAAE